MQSSRDISSIFSIQTFKRLLPHLVAVLFICVFPLLLGDHDSPRSTEFKYRTYVQLVLLIVAFYINYFYLVPSLFFKNRRVLYFLLVVVLVALLVVIQQFAFEVISYDKPRLFLRQSGGGRHEVSKFYWQVVPIVSNIVTLILCIGFSTGVKMVNAWSKNELKQKEQERAHLDSELAMLKNQVSPHFFFNTLNNIYALIDMSGEDAKEAVEKLSNMMRYLIYESDGKQVSIKREVEFMNDYIELMRLRISKKVKVSIAFSTQDETIQVPPLLMISFIENAFKHGISNQSDSFIDIRMKTTDEVLLFTCINSNPQAGKQEKDSVGGIGLSNIKKRLELLYGPSAKLEIESSSAQFLVNLRLPLNRI